MAPVGEWEGQKLRYPIGVADLKEVAGKELDLEALAAVPLFVFLGDKDTNDSVIFRDSYEEEDEKLIVRHFGKAPVDRWPFVEKLYREKLPKATLKLYPGIEHKVTDAIAEDVRAFFALHLGR